MHSQATKYSHLRKISEEVDMSDSVNVDTLAEKLHNRLTSPYFLDGYYIGLRGIAAPQLDIYKRAIGVRLGKMKQEFVLFNPVIVHSSGLQWCTESCFSLPGYSTLVPRCYEVEVSAYLLDGQNIILGEKRIDAAALQHEIDHLDGILIKDYGYFSRKPKMPKIIEG